MVGKRRQSTSMRNSCSSPGSPGGPSMRTMAETIFFEPPEGRPAANACPGPVSTGCVSPVVYARGRHFPKLRLRRNLSKRPRLALRPLSPSSLPDRWSSPRTSLGEPPERFPMLRSPLKLPPSNLLEPGGIGGMSMPTRLPLCGGACDHSGAGQSGG